MKNMIWIFFLMYFNAHTLSGQYFSKQQAFEYEVMNIKRNDASLHSTRADYKNARMLESGGKVFLGLGLIMMPLGMLSELSSISRINLSGNSNHSSAGKGVFFAGVFVGGIGLLSWTIGSTKKNRAVDKYFKEQYGLSDISEEPVGIISASGNGVKFYYAF